VGVKLPSIASTYPPPTRGGGVRKTIILQVWVDTILVLCSIIAMVLKIAAFYPPFSEGGQGTSNNSLKSP